MIIIARNLKLKYHVHQEAFTRADITQKQNVNHQGQKRHILRDLKRDFYPKLHSLDTSMLKYIQ